jgi:hypothetical protein
MQITLIPIHDRRAPVPFDLDGVADDWAVFPSQGTTFGGVS